MPDTAPYVQVVERNVPAVSTAGNTGDTGDGARRSASGSRVGSGSARDAVGA